MPVPCLLVRWYLHSQATCSGFSATVLHVIYAVLVWLCSPYLASRPLLFLSPVCKVWWDASLGLLPTENVLLFQGVQMPLSSRSFPWFGQVCAFSLFMVSTSVTHGSQFSLFYGDLYTLNRFVMKYLWHRYINKCCFRRLNHWNVISGLLTKYSSCLRLALMCSVIHTNSDSLSSTRVLK